jgi:predicted O-methyltransferase YrrM
VTEITQQDKWTEVDRYFSDRMHPDDKVLEDAIAAGEAAGLPQIQVSATQGKLLQILAQTLRASSILEIGTLAGYSTICLARGLRAGGRVVSLEVDPKHAEVAKANFARAGLSRAIDLRVGNALETLPQLAKESGGNFDLIFIDADKANIPAYFEWALRMSHPGTLIIVDNVVRDGGVIDADSEDPSIQGVRRFVEMLAGLKGLSGTTIQTVGTKGYDGFAIVRVE